MYNFLLTYKKTLQLTHLLLVGFDLCLVLDHLFLGVSEIIKLVLQVATLLRQAR